MGMLIIFTHNLSSNETLLPWCWERMDWEGKCVCVCVCGFLATTSQNLKRGKDCAFSVQVNEQSLVSTEGWPRIGHQSVRWRFWKDGHTSQSSFPNLLDQGFICT